MAWALPSQSRRVGQLALNYTKGDTPAVDEYKSYASLKTKLPLMLALCNRFGRQGEGIKTARLEIESAEARMGFGGVGTTM